MKKPVLIVLALLIIAVLGFGAYSLLTKNSSNSDSMMQKDETAMTESDKAMTDSGDAMTDTSTKNEAELMNDDSMLMKADSHYVEYSSKVLADSANTKRVLFFYANWCPTCRPADANFKANIGKIPTGVTLIRVNYNDSDTDAEEKALADKYEVTYQHTFIQIDKDGNPVTRWNGGQIGELLANIK